MTADEFDISVVDLQTAAAQPVDGRRNLASNGFLYGERVFPVTRQAVALAALGEHPGQVGSGIVLSDAIPVTDANGVLAYEAFNFSSDDLGDGFVAIAAHTRTELVGDVSFDGALDPGLETKYVSSLGVIQSDPVNAPREDREQLDAATEAERAMMLGVDPYDLNVLELDNMAALNMIASLESTDVAASMVGATYDGQDSNGGYGGITNPNAYLKDRYGGTWTRSSVKLLTMPGFTMVDIRKAADKASDRNNCVPTAVARVFAHARSEGFTKISPKDTSVYLTARSAASEHGWTISGGTNPVNIDNIIEKMGDKYGYPSTDSKGIYVFSYPNTVQSEIKASRPLLMNIAQGYYAKHTVTVRGYATYKNTAGRTSRMVAVYDGWKSVTRYIDYDAFISSSVGSFNTVDVK